MTPYNPDALHLVRNPADRPPDALWLVVLPAVGGESLADLYAGDIKLIEQDDLETVVTEARYLRVGHGMQSIAVHLSPGAVWEDSLGDLG